MKNLIKNLFILIIITNITKAEEVEKILFSINNKIYTSIDLNNRISYLKISANNNNQLTNEDYIEDFVSALLYNEYAKEYKINIDENIKNDLFKVILKKYKKKSSNIIIREEELLINLVYDYQRKIIIESLLNKKKNDILRNENKIFDIYDIQLDYFTFNSDNEINLNHVIKLIDFNNIFLTKKNLKDEVVDYVYIGEVINSLENLNNSLVNEIFENKEFFIINENDYILVGKFTKTFKKNIGLKITLYKITSNLEINEEIITCNNLDNIKVNKDINIEKFENIEINKISDYVKSNLISINDKVIINDENSKYYLILCEFNYNMETSKEIIINNKIKSEVSKIKDNFLFENKIRYNFKLYE